MAHIDSYMGSSVVHGGQEMGISEVALELLAWMDRDDCADATEYDGELVHEGRIWMAGTKRIPRRIVDELLFFCCIRVDNYSGNMEVWRINGTGREMLVNPIETCKKVNAILGRA